MCVLLSLHTESLLKTVTHALESVLHKYCELGVQLEMPLHKINSLENQYRQPERVMIEIIDWWLREKGLRHSHTKMWTMIIESVERIGENRLAKTLRDVYLQH